MNTPRRPSIFIVGAMKSGSTYLHNLLGAHPAIFMSAPKEPTYFVDQSQLRRVLVNPWAGTHAHSEAACLSLFEGAAEDQLCGESSRNYSRFPELPGAPARIHAFEPHARIIYIMRDPVERALSHYWYSVGEGSENLDLLDALQRRKHYVELSRYAMQLEQYWCVFPRDQVYTMTFEALRDDPLTSVRAVYSWLGVDASCIPKNIGKAANVTADTLMQRRGVLEALRRSPVYQHVQRFVPRRLKSLVRPLSEHRLEKGSVDAGAAKAFLVDQLRAPTRELQALLPLDLTCSRTTLGDAGDGLGARSETLGSA